MNSIVVLGNGIAAITAIKTIRATDKESEIFLYGEERYYPYNRIRLSKGLLDKLEEDKILLQKKAWYEDNNINLIRDVKATKVNVEDKRILLSDGSNRKYDKLILATGASNIAPPIEGIDKQGVYTLRTLNDAKVIINKLESSEKILNIGGGIQGLETAWILSQMGKKMILAELFPRLMPKQLDEKASAILKKAVEAQGIEVLLNTKVSGVHGVDYVKGFKTSNNDSMDCDMVIYSIGIKPNIEVVDGTRIHTNRGVVVNDKMETNIEDVYAVGDLAEYDEQVYGLWNIAIAHGKVAGLNIVGECSKYEHIVPVTTLNAFNIALFSMGIVIEDEADNIVLEDKSEENIYNKVYIKNNKVIGAIVIGNIRYSPILKTAIEKGIDLDGVDYTKVTFSELLETIKSRK